MPKKSKTPIPIEQSDEMIRTIRGVRVMLARDLAKLYGVPTFRFNEAIKRNRHRFPPDFMFQLTGEEFGSLKSQVVKAGQLIAICDEFRQASRFRLPTIRFYLNTAHYRQQMFFAAGVPSG